MFGNGKVHVLFSDLILDRIQFRFPRTRKKRIVKKWKKNWDNWKAVPSKSLRIMDVNRNGELYAVGNWILKPHLEYLNSMAAESNGPTFIFEEWAK